VNESDIAEQFARALGGDQAAWQALVHGLSTLIRQVARAYRLGEADVSDVCQATWCKLVQRPDLREPARLPGWLSTTAHRHALRILTARRREVPTVGEFTAPLPSPELEILSAERDRVLWQAVARLPQR